MFHLTGKKPKIELWAFLLKLLKDQQHKDIIDWTDVQEGEFILSDHEAVAKMWGKCRNKAGKNSDDMKYENMSRTLRNAYKRNILDHGKGTHCYKFLNLPDLMSQERKAQCESQSATNQSSGTATNEPCVSATNQPGGSATTQSGLSDTKLSNRTDANQSETETSDSDESGTDTSDTDESGTETSDTN